MIKKTWYQLEEKDCERLNRSEMQAVRWSLAALHCVAHAQNDLAERLKCIPNGQRRWRLMVGQLRALCNDIIGTTPRKQCVGIQSTMNDMELRFVPKYTPFDTRVVMDVNDLSFLVSHAKKDICSACILTGDECRECELYKILESIAPQQDWGHSTVCPYLREDWFDR